MHTHCCLYSASKHWKKKSKDPEKRMSKMKQYAQLENLNTGRYHYYSYVLLWLCGIRIVLDSILLFFRLGCVKKVFIHPLNNVEVLK